MSSNDQTNSTNPDTMSRHRRSSVTSAALAGIFRSASTSAASSTASTGAPIFPNPLDPSRRRLSVSTTAALGLGSVSNGLNGVHSAGSASSASPSGVGASAFAMRRASLSTNSSTSEGAVDESAIDDDDTPPPSGPRNSCAQNGPYGGRRVSFGAQAGRSNGRQRSVFAAQQPQPAPDSYFPPSASASARRPSVLKSHAAASHTRAGSFSSPSPSHSAVPMSPLSMASYNPRTASPRTVSDKLFFPAARADQGYNWPEQLRSRAESTISGARSSFSHASGIGTSPPRVGGFANYGTGGSGGSTGGAGARHDRAKSVSDVPRQAPVPTQPAPRPETRKKPDPFQERILKGDFYMD